MAASPTGLEIFVKQSSDTARTRSAQCATRKTRWKTSETGNRRLSFYGLNVTVFRNARGWAVSVTENDAPPSYLNFATEPEARAAAEQTFRELKASGKFKPPPPPSPPPLRELVKGFPNSGRIVARSLNDRHWLGCWRVELRQ
jgi:hypothetical protein